ncbi:LIM domain kinase 1 [Psilocybe cubensis]|uniref:LIM domain kinase 1 n=1 Tax=Psilocybe cubensis TaxID=181762 RepID=A0ACB8HI52_PSICU|nr:LIM domain kinase 1 [Psilocybe cubensis]KAH9487437.1 LIM domain kinase 1 [Psilocybe cubensis]
MAEFINESMILDSLRNHPHIVNFIGISCNPDVGPAIITSWMEHGTLTNIIGLDPPSQYRRQMVEQIVDGMSFLKASNVIHGDLKSSNILISYNGRACIADFGLSRFAGNWRSSPPTVAFGLQIAESTLSWLLRVPYPTDCNTRVGAGSPRWMAPELLLPSQWESAHTTFESDIFALGMVIYEVGS